MNNPSPNPYVGPRSFQTGETLYGRERETLELLDLLIAERIVLLYSPSGAGKTSLIQAALTPKLREEGFNVLPPIRVSAEPPPLVSPSGSKAGVGTKSIPNRFVLSALFSLEQKLPQEKRLALSMLTRMTLDEYLKQRTDLAETSPVLVFDQFEEVLTVDVTNLDAKAAFFEQVGEALRDRSRWALFSMREDYLAGLDPYLKPIPTRFATTYRLDLLGVNAAREAIQKPARKGGVDFTDAAAEKLVNDLRRVQVQRPDGSVELQPGPYVEPVQLQVVCYRLWDKLPEGKATIAESEIGDVGDVNTALADYYASSVQQTARTTSVSERAIRDWFDRQLITEQGIRGQVLMEREASRGLSNKAIRMLEDAHLVRADERRGSTWFELAHDRLIEPVRASNAAWFRANLSALQQAAELWSRQDRADGLLLRDKPLQDAEAWAKEHSGELTQTEKDFLAESQEAQQVIENKQRQNRRIRLLAIVASVVGVIALLGIVVALVSLAQLGDALEETDKQREIAVANEQEAQRQREEVVTQDRVSKMVSASLSQLEVDPEVSLLLATQAFSTTADVQTDDVLRQAVIASRLRETFVGHTAHVLNADISPDGTRIATASEDGTARVWDIDSGEVLATLGGNQGSVWSVTYSPDGSQLATTDDKGTRVWDVECLKAGDSNEGCVTRELGGHASSVYLAAFSPDGLHLVTASDDHTAIVWNLASGAQEHVLGGHASAVNSAAFSPDGTKIVTASADQTLRVWDLTKCTPDCAFQEYKGPTGAMWNASFSPDGQYVVAASEDQNAYKFNVADGNIETFFIGHTDTVFGATFSPDGELIVTASADGTARLWDANYGVPLAVLRGHTGNVNSVAFNEDGELIVTASDDGTAKLWNEGSGIELKTVRGHTNKIFSVAFSPDGRRVATASQDKTAGVWDAATGLEVLPPLVGHTDWVTDANFSPDGMHLVTTSDDGTVRLWDLTACNESECPSVQIEIAEGVVAQHAVFSPDGGRVLTAGSDGKMELWDAKTGQALPFASAGGEELTSAVFSPDGKRIVTASVDGKARVWDAETGAAGIVLEGHAGALTSAVFSPDGTWIVTGSADRTARVWDATTGAEKMTLRGHNGAVNGVAISPDGTLILTASSDKTARLWDAATGVEVSILRGHTDGLTGAAFSPDGKFVATSSSDRTARITLTRIADIYALAHTRATRGLSCDEWRAYLQESGYCPTNGSTTSPLPVQTLLATKSGGGSGSTVQPQATVPAGLLPTAAETTMTVVLSPTPEATSTNAVLPLLTATAIPSAPPIEAATKAPPASAPATATRPVAPTTAPTAVPEAPPGVYALSIRYAQVDPNIKPTQLVFSVNFLNNTGKDASYPHWRVLVYRQGETNKSFGDTSGVSRTIPNGSSVQETVPWKINVGSCENFVAVPIWEDNEARRTPFLKPDGSALAVQFPVCP